ncbi:MAG TPA: 5'-deoxynucleotidase [Clostridiales bacterium]|nr:5'-deoxynucleotidase [Clostridiales bacterium]
MSSNFFAMMHRMRFINRWGLMRNTEQENIQEHSLQVAMIAHALAVLRRRYYADGRPPVDERTVALMAIYHDASEILTGDLPTPVKYFNPAIREAYKAVESVAAAKLLTMLPDDLAPNWQPLIDPDLNDPATQAAHQLVKAADRLSAYIKCIDEGKAGNSEFRQASKTVRASLDELAESLPEVRYFMDHFLPAFQLSLDELQ